IGAGCESGNARKSPCPPRNEGPRTEKRSIAMTPIEELMPRTPSWRVDWQALRDAFEWIRALDGVPHDPQHHAEGDVGVHCRMVAEALADSAFFRNLVADSPDAALALWAATLLHDVA